MEINRENMIFAAVCLNSINPDTLMKRIPILLAIVVAACLSCNRMATEETAARNDTVSLTVTTFLVQADSCVDKPVVIEGIVSHICKHGGKRLFLADEKDSLRVEVTTGPSIAKFDDALSGSRLRVTGILKEERIDAKYLNEWEAEVKKPEENHAVGIHTGAKGHEDQGVQEKLDQINALREELKNSGKDHLSFFSVEAVSFTELK